MILGVGIDLIEVARVEHSIERFGERFLRRVLLESEIRYCLAHKRPGPHVAARFAAKEAVSKAFGTGIGGQLGWHDIEVERKESGEPFVTLRDKACELMKARGAQKLHLTLSHTEHHATAFVILEA